MNKLTLIAKAVLADAKNPDIADDKKLETIEDGLRTFAVECLNLLNYLKENSIAQDVITGIIATQGVDFDGRTKKYK